MALKTLARIGPAEPMKTEADYLPVQVTLSLANHIRDCYTQAKSAKQHIAERLLRCERQRRGEYDPEVLMQIKKYGGSEVYLMLTDIKCRAAEAWIKDVMLSAGENPWKVEATNIPSVPMEMHDQILQTMEQMVMQAQQAGEQVTPEMVDELVAGMHDQVLQEIKKAADMAADRMSDKILDDLQEDDWNNTLSDIVYDFVTFPSCIIKGPVVKRGKKMAWGNNWTPVVIDEKATHFYRVSPYDAFPSPNATDTQDGYFIERHRFMRADLEEMRGVPGFNDKEIEKAISLYGKGGLREMTFGETERDWLSGRNTQFGSNEIIEGIEYWGTANGEALAEWGMKGLEKYKEYQVSAILIGECVIKAVINPDPLGRRPYSKASFIRVPGAFWGQALPESMKDIQLLCNSSGRAIANNMGVASGPQVEVSVDRLPDGEDVTNMYPWKIWQTTSDRTGGGQPAIRFFQPNMNADVLLNVLQYFARIADEVTGVPNYIYGSAQSSGAGRTASGLSMLMDNASKGIKQAILNLDRGINAMLERHYYYLMVYDPDQSIKGDMRIIPAGVVGALMKDHINEKRTAFLQMVSNPMDFQIMGAGGRAELLHQIGSGMQLEMEGVLPSKDKISELGQASPEMQQAQQMIEQLQGALQQAQQQLSSKEAELEFRYRELDANLEEVRISAQAQIEARTNENIHKAERDAEAKVRAAEIAAETQLVIAEMRESTAREAHELKYEADLQKTASDKEAKIRDAEATAVQQTQAKEAKDETAVQLVELVKAIANQPAPVINVQVDAAKGEVKKSVTVKRDKDGNIVGADVKEV
jgi:hypothetical protein